MTQLSQRMAADSVGAAAVVPFLGDQQVAVLVETAIGNALDAEQPTEPAAENRAEIDALDGFLQLVAELQQESLQCLATYPFADVGEGADRALQHAFAVQRGHPIFHRQAAAILAVEQLMFGVGRLAGTRGVPDRAMLWLVGSAIRMAVADDFAQLTSLDLFLAGETEQPDERLVAHGDLAIGVDGVEPFADRIQQQPGEGLALQAIAVGPAAIVDVLGGEDPVQQLAVLVVDGSAACLEPAQGTIGIQQGQFEHAGKLGAQDVPPLREHPLALVLADGGEPAIAARSLRRQVGEGGPVAVAETQRAVRLALPDHLRAEVDECAVALFGLPGRGLLEAGGGQVAQDLDEATEGAALVLHRHHHAAGPELRAVLALVPPLVDGRAAFLGRAHFRFQNALSAVFGGEDAAGGAADDLRCLPAEDALCPFVPAGDLALRAAGENGVVHGAVDDLAVALVDVPRPAQFQRRRRLARQGLEVPELARRQLARLVVEQAEGSQWQAFRRAQHGGGIETGPATGGGLRLLREVFDHQRIGLQNGAGAERTVAWLAGATRPARGGLAPQASIGHEMDGGAGDGAEIDRQLDQIIEGCLGRGIQNAIADQRR